MSGYLTGSTRRCVDGARRQQRGGERGRWDSSDEWRAAAGEWDPHRRGQRGLARGLQRDLANDAEARQQRHCSCSLAGGLWWRSTPTGTGHRSQIRPGTGKAAEATRIWTGLEEDCAPAVEDERRRARHSRRQQGTGTTGAWPQGSSMASLTSEAQRGNEEGWRRELQALPDGAERRPTAGRRHGRDEGRRSAMAEGGGGARGARAQRRRGEGLAVERMGPRAGWPSWGSPTAAGGDGDAGEKEGRGLGRRRRREEAGLCSSVFLSGWGARARERERSRGGRDGDRGRSDRDEWLAAEGGTRGGMDRERGGRARVRGGRGWALGRLSLGSNGLRGSGPLLSLSYIFLAENN